MAQKSITLILDNLRSCHNVGSILRTADGFGVKHVVMVGTTPYPELQDDTRLPHQRRKQTAQIAKTALGAEQKPIYSYVSDYEELLQLIGNLPIYSLEQTNSSVELGMDIKHPEFALVVGNEVSGVSPILIDASISTLEIPMAGQKESFNVSVATGIALYALL